MKYINIKGVIEDKTLIERFNTIVVKDGDNNLYIFSVDYNSNSFNNSIIEINSDDHFYAHENEFKYWEDFLNVDRDFINYKIIDKFEDSSEYEITITRK